MPLRLTRVVSAIAATALGATLIAGLSRPAVAEQQLDLPPHLELVQNIEGQTWADVKPGTRRAGTVGAVIHLELPPLALVGKNWSHEQRLAHVAKIRAAQDALAPQVEAIGGRVRGRLTHLAAGLAVEVDAARTDDLRAFGGVLSVHGVSDYTLDLSETVPFIGGTVAQDLGYTGAGVDVAVIDSGVDFSHVKLGGLGTVEAYNEAYCGNAATPANPTDPACTANDFADATGFFGDAQYGRDGSPENKVVGGWDWVGEEWPNGPTRDDPNPIDYEGHGTHVADIIGGLESEAGAKDAGVAPGANIWGYKACSAVSSSCEGIALLLAVDDAMDLDDSDYGACTPGADAYCLAYDPADVINMSLGSSYGQPEDDLTLFADIASYYGSLVVASAGNSGDRPYIVGSPSAASGALSVAQSTVPSDAFYQIQAGNITASGVLQPWSPAPSGPLSGALQFGNGAGGNLLGCSAFPAGSLAGKVLLVDRGTCSVSVKMSNGAAAGALFVIVANNSPSNTPPSFSFGGGTSFAPTFTVTQNDGFRLKTVLGQVASTSPESTVSIADDIVASSSRGPRIKDNAIKPDIAAPGASVSAEVGTGSGKTAFGGTSGAAPMVAGGAALLVEKFERVGLLDSDPGLDSPLASIASLTPVIKALLMNTANPNTYIGGAEVSGFLSPITLQGSGRIDIAKAIQTETIAWDVTGLAEWVFNPNRDWPCQAHPVEDVLRYINLGAPPECAADFPFGNDFFNAFNSQTGSVSFGYDGVASTAKETRTIFILNFSGVWREYDLSTSFRYGNDVNRGVKVTPSERKIIAPPLGGTLFNVTLDVNANRLRDWTTNAGEYGASGTDINCVEIAPGVDCPTLNVFEYDGYVTIEDGENNTVALPWHVLPKRVANPYVTSATRSRVTVRNSARYKSSETEIFGLVEQSPNNCEITDGDGNCVTEDYVPGILPGISATAIDIKEVGVRHRNIEGINAALGFANPAGARPDEVLDFGLTVYDAPFRASHNFPVEFDVYIDSNTDGTYDYVVFNYDFALNGSDGRNATFVADLNPADGTRPLRPYFFTDTDINSQNWILPVPAEAVGVRSNVPFDFYVLAFDAYFTGDLWDCSPFDCNSAHRMTLDSFKYDPSVGGLWINPTKSALFGYSRPRNGATLSPAQDGFLLIHRFAPVGKESEAVVVAP